MMFLTDLSGNYLNLFLAGIFGMLLLSISLVVFFIVYQRRILGQERLRQREVQVHQKELLTAAVEVQEAERSRIASDLHDDIGSLLSATRLYLRQLKPTTTKAKTGEIRDQALAILDEMIQNTRRITHDLSPPALEKFGFQAAAEDLCERINGSGGMRVIFSSTSEERLHPKREIALYRVLQELLNNTIKHARADTVGVEVGQGPEQFKFIYQDNGRGFDPEKTKLNGLGLRNMESRVTLMGGSMSFESSPGKGLRVEVAVPSKTR